LLKLSDKLQFMFLLNEEYKAFNILASTVVTADLDGTGIDLEQYEADALVILQTGLISSTVATYAVNVQGSTSVGGTYTTISSFTTVGSGSDYGVAVLPVNIEGASKKFVRVQVDATANGGSINGIFGAVLLAKPQVAQSGLNTQAVA
jgi:hypothetical protein